MHIALIVNTSFFEEMTYADMLRIWDVPKDCCSTTELQRLLSSRIRTDDQHVISDNPYASTRIGHMTYVDMGRKWGCPEGQLLYQLSYRNCFLIGFEPTTRDNPLTATHVSQI